MAKIMLINPYFVEGFRGFPLGLAYLAGAMYGKHDVYGIDLTALSLIEKRDANEILKRELEMVKPDAVGITSTSPTHLAAIEAARGIKELNPGIIVIKGGPHETNCAETTLRYHPEIDISVIGEGEVTINELLWKIEKSKKNGKPVEGLNEVKGIAFREGNNVIKTQKRELFENLDWPFADGWTNRDIFFSAKTEKYYTPSIFGGQKTAPLLTSRGCVNTCSFCSSKANWGRFRIRSVEDVDREIRGLMYNGFKAFAIEDDMFPGNEDWFLRFAETAKDYGISYSCQTRATVINERTAKALAESGCKYIYFGVESGVQEILNRCGKNVTIGQMARAYGLLRENGIRNMASVQFGLDGEDTENFTTVRETIRVLNEVLMPDEVSVSYTSLYPGSPLAKKYGITPEAYEHHTGGQVNNLVGKISHGVHAIHPPCLNDEKIMEIEYMLDQELKIPRWKMETLFSK